MPQLQRPELEVERAVLATILLEPARQSVVDEIERDLFQQVEHRSVFEAMERLRKRKVTIDQRTLQAELTNLGRLEAVGGPAFLSSFDLDLPDPGRIDHYLEILRERRLRRQGTDVLERTIGSLKSDGRRSPEIVRELRDELLRLELGATVEEFKPWPEVLSALVRKITAPEAERELAIGTGFPDLDSILAGGLHQGELVILSGLTGRGKTVLGTNIAWYVAGEKFKPVAYFSQEMAAQELALRNLSALTGMRLTDLRQGRIPRSSEENLVSFVQQIMDAKLYIEDSGSSTPQKILAACRRMKDQGSLSLVVVDYIQILRPDREHENKNAEVSEATRVLKTMAMELEVPVLALSQFSRKVAMDKRAPELHDLRDSGAIEQDADVVLALHRPKWEDPTTELLILKHRNGETGKLKLRFDAPRVRFQSLDEKHSEEE